MNPDTFACPLTGPGVGAVAVVLLTGPRAAEILARMCSSPRLAQLPIGESLLAHLHHPPHQNAAPPAPIDQALIIRTGDSQYELHLHGGIAVMGETQSALQAAAHDGRGARSYSACPARPGSHPSRSPPRPRLRQTPAAARHLLHQPAAWQRGCALVHVARGSKSAAHLWRFHAAIQWLLERSRTLQFLLTPARIALIGAPNVGKSTLANTLLGRPVSITSELAGTTRDWVDAQAIFSAPSSAPASGTASGGRVEIPVTLVDTAGIRPPADALESESIARTHGQAAAADVIILLFDATRPPTPEELARAHHYRARTVLAINKTDAASILPAALQSLSAVNISARTKTGLDALMQAILQQLDLSAYLSRNPLPSTPASSPCSTNYPVPMIWHPSAV